MKFVKIKDDVFLKMIDLKRNRSEYIAIKDKQLIGPNTWGSKFGDYQLTNNFAQCNNCDGQDYTNEDTAKIYMKDGHLILEIKGKNASVDEKIYLNIISENLAVIGGIGRGAGETVSVLENGNIYYSGFEFAPIL